MLLSRVWLFCDPMDCSPPLSLEFSRQEYWSGFPFSSPGDFPNPGIKSGYPVLQADSLPSEPPGKPCVRKLRTTLSNLDITYFGRKNIIFMSLDTYVICTNCDRIKSVTICGSIYIHICKFITKKQKNDNIYIFFVIFLVPDDKNTKCNEV